MAWIEQRRRKFITFARIAGRKVTRPHFGDREEAEPFMRPVGQAPTDDPDPEHDLEEGPALGPASLRERAGVSVGELVRLHVAGLEVRTCTREQCFACMRDHVDTFFGDVDAGFVIRVDHRVTPRRQSRREPAGRSGALQPRATRIA